MDLMPELPDVEVFRQYVDATSLHQTIEAVAIDAPRMLKHTATKTVRSWLGGADLAATRRHGKHLLVKTSRGPWLVLHFGMTGRLDETDLAGLHRAVRHVLRLAIERRADPEQVPGSWLLPHRSPDESCPRCSGHIERATIGGRSAYYCPRCQK